MESPNIIINPVQMNKIGLLLLSIIRDRTAQGKDKDGNDFKPYSKRAFKMPYKSAVKTAINELVKQGKATIIKQGGVKKVIVKTGYLDYKMLVYQGTSYDGTVNLMLTGSMLRNMQVLSTNSNQIVIGFNNPDMAQRAKYNIDRGRDFFGLSDKDFENPKLLDLIQEGLIIE